MKKLILSLAILVCFVNIYSQTDTVLLKKYEDKISEITNLKTELKTISLCYKKDTLELQKQIKDLKNEVTTLNHKIINLNKNKIKIERDQLLHSVDSLNIIISTLNQNIIEINKQIEEDKINTNQLIENARKEAKAETIKLLINYYKETSFDSLLIYSTKKSIERDFLIIGHEESIKQILKDLLIYFNAQESLSIKFDLNKNQQILNQLEKINRESSMIISMKEKLRIYEEYNNDLKQTILKIIQLDSITSTGDDLKLQKLKFNDIMLILSVYVYDNYTYPSYPFINNIIIEIIKIKKFNADAPIIDLLKTL